MKFHPLAVAVLCLGCESLGIKAHVTTWKTKNGQTEVKHREVKNWQEFEEAMSDVGTDMSDVAKEMSDQTTALVKTLVDVPPPGEVKLSDLSPNFRRFEGKSRLDFLELARKKKNAGYDFRYVKIGEAAYDDFFKASAEAYALSFMRRETARRIRKLGAGLLDVEEKSLAGADPDQILERAKKLEPSDETAEPRKYLGELGEPHGALNDNPLLGATRVNELVTTGQRLAAAAPSSITNPKVLLHVGKVVEGIEQSVRLIRDAAAADDEAG